MHEIAYEIIFTGLPGQTHTYSGLSYGNIPSEVNQNSFSNPRAAALQALKLMKSIADLGIGQAVLPPHERPFLPALKSLGFGGTESEILQAAHRHDPKALMACSSSAAMWAANAATVSPSADTEDRKLHFTPANLISNFHRSIEAASTSTILKSIFPNPDRFVHHAPLPAALQYSDEGAANHCRVANRHQDPGVELFVYGKNPYILTREAATSFPSRQSLLASRSISRLHQLDEQYVLFVHQNPEAIDAGAFHNDVVGVANENFLFLHEKSFLDQHKVLDELQKKYSRTTAHPRDLIIHQVKAEEIPLSVAVETYLFNSQIVTLPSGEMALIAPKECSDNPLTRKYIESLHNDPSNPVKQVHYVDVKQSMLNGGGPACLRLRIVLTQDELAEVNSGIFLDGLLYNKLVAWVEKHYRDRLHPSELADPNLLKEVYEALNELTGILNLGSIYNFQQ